MGAEPEETFTKIVIDLPEAEDGVGGEGVWTVQVGPELYEVRNSPFHTLEINFKDVVRAVAPTEDKHPVFTEVFKRGGHRAIQIVFLDQSEETKREVLKGINELGASYENADGVLYAIDLPPEASFDAVADYLQRKQDAGLLEQRYAPQPQPPGSGEVVN
jgi:hypothetical protein